MTFNIHKFINRSNFKIFLQPWFKDFLISNVFSDVDRSPTFSAMAMFVEVRTFRLLFSLTKSSQFSAAFSVVFSPCWLVERSDAVFSCVGGVLPLWRDPAVFSRSGWFSAPVDCVDSSGFFRSADPRAKTSSRPSSVSSGKGVLVTQLRSGVTRHT